MIDAEKKARLVRADTVGVRMMVELAKAAGLKDGDAEGEMMKEFHAMPPDEQEEFLTILDAVETFIEAELRVRLAAAQAGVA